MEAYLQVMDDAQLEQIVGGDGHGYVKTLTKDCPDVVDEICIGIGPIQACKSCS